MPVIENEHFSEVELQSDEVQDLISFRPHWIIRKGNAIFFLLFMVLLAFAWFIKYPDIVKGSMKLVAVNAPKRVVIKTEGKLEKLLIVNQQHVEQEQPLAFLKSIAVHEQVLILQKWLNEVEPFIAKDSFEILLIHPLPSFDKLGEVQSAYQDFQNIWEETLQILGNGYYQQKKKALLKDNAYLSSIQNNENGQLSLIRQDYDLQQTEYKANELLAMEKVIAPIELNQNKSKVISKEQSLQQAHAQLIYNDIASHNKQKEIMDLNKFIIDQRQKLRSALYILKSKIEAWVQQYIIVAPEAGIVLFTSFLQENQLLSAGQELFYIQPPQSQYYGQMMVAQTGFGKIKEGQRVLIKVESYPSAEFGYLRGSVSFISKIPTEKDSFLVKVDLRTGLQTNYNKSIVFRNSLSAQAEVITDERKLFDRFLGQLNQLSKQQ
jgi:multidrug efflux pump subunit AcrA (membrane-fusion protein)